MARFLLEDISEKVNPFTASLRIEVTEKVQGEGKVYLEKDEYAKVFVNSDKRKFMCKLNDVAKGMFIWLLYSVEPSKDIIQIDRVRSSRELDIRSTATFYKGLNALIDKGIICKVNGTKHSYWINPQVFFNGSRPNKYPEQTVIVNKGR